MVNRVVIGWLVKGFWDVVSVRWKVKEVAEAEAIPLWSQWCTDVQYQA